MSSFPKVELKNRALGNELPQVMWGARPSNPAINEIL
jgi:hypothetical protein